MKYYLKYISLAVGLVMVANFFLARMLVIYFLSKEANLRSQPVSRVVSSKESLLDVGSDVVLYGDSRVVEWELPQEPSSAKLGVNGATSVELFWALSDFDYDVKGKNVFIQCGINDLKSLGYVDTPSIEVVDTCVKSIRGIADFFVEKEAASVVVLGVFPTSQVPLWRKPFWNEEIETARLKVNAEISELELKWDYLDCDHLFVLDSMFRDQLHLSPDSYQLLNEFIHSN